MYSCCLHWASRQRCYCATQICIARIYLLRRRGWVSVCPYCVKTARPVLKLFQSSDSLIILVSSDPAPMPNSKQTPSAWAPNTQGGTKNWRFSCDFWRLSRKQCKIGRLLLWNVNRKSLVPDCMYLWSRFQGHDIFRHWISQKRHEIEP